MIQKNGGQKLEANVFLKKKSESGRSMVEMLGVLAIIGVLSIGGIAGYTLSMRRYRANQVLDALNKYALVVYGDCQKALLDGDISNITECHTNFVPSFSEASLGTVADTYGIWDPYITQQSGIDTVNISVSFRDIEVCKSAKSIIGSKYDWDCTGNGSNTMIVPVKFN